VLNNIKMYNHLHELNKELRELKSDYAIVYDRYGCSDTYECLKKLWDENASHNRIFILAKKMADNTMLISGLKKSSIDVDRVRKDITILKKRAKELETIIKKHDYAKMYFDAKDKYDEAIKINSEYDKSISIKNKINNLLDTIYKEVEKIENLKKKRDEYVKLEQEIQNYETKHMNVRSIINEINNIADSTIYKTFSETNRNN